MMCDNKSILLILLFWNVHSLSLLFQLLSQCQIMLSHLHQIFLKQNLSVLPIFSLLFLLENVVDVLLQLFWMTNIDKLQCIFYGNLTSASEIIHQELGQIKKIPGLQTCFVENASLVHQSELVLINTAIEILINFPNPLIYFRFTKWE